MCVDSCSFLLPQLGEITFFSLHNGNELAYFSMRGCIDQLLLAKKSDHTTHLLVSCSLCIIIIIIDYVCGLLLLD